MAVVSFKNRVLLIEYEYFSAQVQFWKYKNYVLSKSTWTFEDEYEYKYSEKSTQVVLEYEYQARVLQHCSIC